MEKTINIGGRLHNPAVGGSVAGADEIKDDTKGKMQNVINQETDAELVRLDEAKQEKLTFDQIPTEGSTNPVTSGGVHAADAALQQAIEAILLLIPSAASALNQLADKSFVNSSISTATATFRGTYNLVTDLELTVSATHQQIATTLASVVSTADNNDYCFVQIPVSDQSTDIRVTERYKFDGTSWEYEYDLNNSGFTADQWGAINSGITSVLVGKLGGLPTAAELATMFAGKQNTLTFDNTPVAGSDNPVKSSGLYNAFAAINALIPTGADANNKLVAENRLVAYVTTLINALDATFDVTSADGHVTLRMTQADGVITSVQILTSDIASDAALTTLGGRVSTAESDIDALQDAYAALTQSDVVIVEGALPSSGQQQNIIYRQLDQEHTPPQFYSDYMWNGTTWVLMATYMNAIDPRPKKGSQNLVTSGGVFDNMGALDVSELNATENPHTLATYADLSAALAAIPSDYQKGGMSIKFVQSSDNKYVQYRLMSDLFNTTEANWQGVDAEPTANSKNIVESGGVFNKLYGEEVLNTTYVFEGSQNKIFSPIAEGERYHLEVTSSASTFLVSVMVQTSSGYIRIARVSETEPIHDIVIPAVVSNVLLFNAENVTVTVKMYKIEDDVLMGHIYDLNHGLEKTDNNVSVLERRTAGNIAVDESLTYTGNQNKFVGSFKSNEKCVIQITESLSTYLRVDFYISTSSGTTFVATIKDTEKHIVTIPNNVSSGQSPIIANASDNTIHLVINKVSEDSLQEQIVELNMDTNTAISQLGTQFDTRLSNDEQNTIGKVFVDGDYTYVGNQNKVFNGISAGDKYIVQITEASEETFRVEFFAYTNTYVSLDIVRDKEMHIIEIPSEITIGQLTVNASDVTIHLLIKKVNDNSLQEQILELSAVSNVFNITPSTGLLKGILAATQIMDATVYVKEGTYDLIQEFKDYYGDDFFDNFPSTNYIRGIMLKNRVTVIFSYGAKVECHYTGDNANVQELFSPFNSQQYGFTLRNLYLRCSRVRYGIHDEMGNNRQNGGSYENTYDNCDIQIDNTDNDVWHSSAAIGGGLGDHGTIKVINCTFETIDPNIIGDFATVSWHNSPYDGVQSKLVLSGNYFKGTFGRFRLSWYGGSPLISTAILSNNSFGGSIIHRAENAQAYDVHNTEIIEWNNVIRN